MAAKKTNLALVTSTDGAATVIAAAGTLDLATAEQLKAAAQAALEQGHDVTLDVSGLSMCDSTGLGAMMRLHRVAQALGREFAIRNPRRHISDLLVMTGISKVITVRHTDG